MTLQEFKNKKKESVHIYWDEVFHEEDDPDWRQKHKLGPVHVQIKCVLCGKILFRDLKEFGWVHNRSFLENNLIPHLIYHVTVDVDDYSI